MTGTARRAESAEPAEPARAAARQADRQAGETINNFLSPFFASSFFLVGFFFVQSRPDLIIFCCHNVFAALS